MSKLRTLIGRGIRKLRLFSRIWIKNREVSSHAQTSPDLRPVVFFNASARIEALNLNAAFQLLTSWGVQLAGREVHYFACQAGMKQCVLGAGLGDPQDPPPCQDCIAHTRLFTGSAAADWFVYQEDPQLGNLLAGSSLEELQGLVYQGRPLGELVLPSLRWILRRHHLEDNSLTRYLFTAYLLSAHSIAEQASLMLAEINPEVVVVFNGLQYPEAVVRWVAQQAGIRVITHEVNLRPFSAFFTAGQATIYPMDIPDDFQLSPAQDRVLDGYLAKRFQGDFKMAGVKFWSDMDQLPGDLLDFAAGFKGIIPVFTNVIFDTSQAHANTIFPDMFAWLDLVYEAARKHPEQLFVIRAHPDEMRAGKSSRESVMSWAEKRGISAQANVILIGPDETLSSYELIQRSKFTMVYNSSIGLEASLLGSPVLCAGKARYTQYPTVFFPASTAEYLETLERFLEEDQIQVPPEFVINARRFLYFQLYRTSIPFDEFLVEHPSPGYVQLKDFTWKKLLPGGSRTIDCVVSGILGDRSFILETDEGL